MTREWKPGDVAMVECSDGGWRQATCAPIAVGSDVLVWRFPDHNARYVELSTTRPLVVIDPEDREQVERLVDVVRSVGLSTSVPLGFADKMQAALRKFADPKPPKPDEPQGLGAVVQAIHGNHFVRCATGDHPWQRVDEQEGERLCRYADIDVVRVLSEGVPNA